MDGFYGHAARMIELLQSPLGLLGLTGQLMFASRFIVQWWVSEKRGESVVPFSFWILSLAGCAILLIYTCLRGETVIFLGLLPGVAVYTRNIVLLRRHNKRLSPGMIHGEKVTGDGNGG